MKTRENKIFESSIVFKDASKSKMAGGHQLCVEWLAGFPISAFLQLFVESEPGFFCSWCFISTQSWCLSIIDNLSYFMNHMTYFNFLWKMAHVEDAFCGTCQMWKVPLWKMTDVEHGKCGTWLKIFCGRWPMWKMAVEQGRHSSFKYA